MPKQFFKNQCLPNLRTTQMWNPFLFVSYEIKKATRKASKNPYNMPFYEERWTFKKDLSKMQILGGTWRLSDYVGVSTFLLVFLVLLGRGFDNLDYSWRRGVVGDDRLPAAVGGGGKDRSRSSIGSWWDDVMVGGVEVPSAIPPMVMMLDWVVRLVGMVMLIPWKSNNTNTKNFKNLLAEKWKIYMNLLLIWEKHEQN